MTQEFVTLPREVVKQALEAFETDDWQKKMQSAINIRAALEQSQGEQAPVAWLWVNKQTGAKGVCFEIPAAFHPDYLWRHLYTHPQPKREPLTDDVIADLMMRTWGCASIAPRHAPTFARAIERAHNIK